MNGLKNLEEILEILMKQEEMVSLMEELQEEKERAEADWMDLMANQKKLEAENHSLKEQLKGSLQLNEQQLSQNRRLQEQIDRLKNLSSR